MHALMRWHFGVFLCTAEKIFHLKISLRLLRSRSRASNMFAPLGNSSISAKKMGREVLPLRCSSRSKVYTISLLGFIGWTCSAEPDHIAFDPFRVQEKTRGQKLFLSRWFFQSNFLKVFPKYDDFGGGNGQCRYYVSFLSRNDENLLDLVAK